MVIDYSKGIVHRDYSDFKTDLQRTNYPQKSNKEKEQISGLELLQEKNAEEWLNTNQPSRQD